MEITPAKTYVIINRPKVPVPEKLNEMDRRSALASIIGLVVLFFACTECLLLFHFSHVNTFFFCELTHIQNPNRQVAEGNR